MSRNTRQRILVASLLLFNEHGEPGTRTNEIADEVDISPGNLHYHFRRKADIIAALLDEFQADTRRVLHPPDEGAVSIDDFWVFLHLLLELTAAYRFLFRDLESLTESYPQVQRVLGQFARALRGVFEIHLRRLAEAGQLDLPADDARLVARNLAVMALFTDRFDSLVGGSRTADDAALRVASSILSALKPLSVGATSAHIESLAARYES